MPSSFAIIRNRPPLRMDARAHPELYAVGQILCHDGCAPASAAWQPASASQHDTCSARRHRSQTGFGGNGSGKRSSQLSASICPCPWDESAARPPRRTPHRLKSNPAIAPGSRLYDLRRDLVPPSTQRRRCDKDVGTSVNVFRSSLIAQRKSLIAHGARGRASAPIGKLA
jgi:hypothetical protein